jgi:hypothetical protein
LWQDVEFRDEEPVSQPNQRLLVALLRIFGGVTALAFFAMFLPADWMAVTHRWLGLGDFPRAPVVDYLTRSVSALYAFHGGVVLLASTNPVHYKTLVRYIGWTNVAFGVACVFIDLHAGMPAYWTIAEGPPVVGVGAVVLYLSRSL